MDEWNEEGSILDISRRRQLFTTDDQLSCVFACVCAIAECNINSDNVSVSWCHSECAFVSVIYNEFKCVA